MTNKVATTGRKRLLVLASTYPRYAGDHEPGFVHELSRRLLPYFEVIAVVPSAPGALSDELLDGVQVVRFRYAPRRFETLVNDGGIGVNLQLHRWKWLLVPGFVLGQLYAVWRLARRLRVDLIHAHWLIPQGLVAALAGLAWSIPIAVTSHGADVYSFRGKLLLWLKRWVAARAARLSVVGGAMRNELARAGLQPKGIWVRSMGVDLQDRFVPRASSRAPDQILFVGRLVEKKGLRFLVQAMPRILQKRPSARLTVAGFGPELQGLKSLAEQLRLTEKIRFLGAVPQMEVARLLNWASLTVAPFVEAASGDQEGLPLALLEAIGCGCPVVAGDVAGVREVLGERDGKTVIDARDVEMLATAVVEKLSAGEHAAIEAGAMRQRVVEHFEWAAVARDYGEWLHAATL